MVIGGFDKVLANQQGQMKIKNDKDLEVGPKVLKKIKLPANPTSIVKL